MATDTDTETGGLALTGDMAFDRHPQLHRYHLLVWNTCLEFCVALHILSRASFYTHMTRIYLKNILFVMFNTNCKAPM